MTPSGASDKSYKTKIQSRLSVLQNNVASEFIIDSLSKAPARFNLKKLQWFNREYIKMFTLGEFVWCAQTLRLEKRFNDTILRPGDYIYFADLTKQTVLTNLNSMPNYLDGVYHFLDGGREVGEDSITNLTREIAEETERKLTFDPTNLHFVTRFQFTFNPISETKLYVSKTNPHYRPQVSLINGKEVPYDTKGSVRPELYKPGLNIEVKNYTIRPGSNSGLVNNVAKNITRECRTCHKEQSKV
jgi:hypothetical protein